MIGAVILAVAVAGIAWSAWAEAQVGREARRDREFARRHAVRPSADTDGPRWQRDPSPRRRAS